MNHHQNCRYDYFKIIPESANSFAVYGYGIRNGVFHRKYLRSYNTLEAAQQDFAFATIDYGSPYLRRDEPQYDEELNFE